MGRLEQDKICLLVMIGVRADGRKELIAVTDGFRVVCVRLSGRVSGLIRDREFDLEQEQRPGAGRDAAAAGARWPTR